MMIMMVCSGASEQAVSQWASTFAEQGLGVSKTVGDLAGPLAFAALMGTSRLLYGKFGDKLNLNKCMFFSACLCVISYLCIALIPVPAIGLIGCALCGFSVGVIMAGHVQQIFCSNQKRRHCYVCNVGSCGRSRMLRRSYSCRFGFGKL